MNGSRPPAGDLIDRFPHRDGEIYALNVRWP